MIVIIILSKTFQTIQLFYPITTSKTKKKLTIDHNNNVKMILDILYWIYPNASIQVLA